MQQARLPSPPLPLLERGLSAASPGIDGHPPTGRHPPPWTARYALFSGPLDSHSHPSWRTRTTVNVDVPPVLRDPPARGPLGTIDPNRPRTSLVVGSRAGRQVNQRLPYHCQPNAAAPSRPPRPIAAGHGQSRSHRPALCPRTGFGPTAAAVSGIGGRLPSIPGGGQPTPITSPVQPSALRYCCIVPLCPAMPASQVDTGPCSPRDRRQSAVIKHGTLLPINCWTK